MEHFSDPRLVPVHQNPTPSLPIIVHNTRLLPHLLASGIPLQKRKALRQISHSFRIAHDHKPSDIAPIMILLSLLPPSFASSSSAGRRVSAPTRATKAVAPLINKSCFLPIDPAVEIMASKRQQLLWS